MMVRLSTLQIEVRVLIVAELREIRDRRRKKLANSAAEAMVAMKAMNDREESAFAVSNAESSDPENSHLQQYSTPTIKGA
jgi:hypothetical protein